MGHNFDHLTTYCWYSWLPYLFSHVKVNLSGICSFRQIWLSVVYDLWPLVYLLLKTCRLFGFPIWWRFATN